MRSLLVGWIVVGGMIATSSGAEPTSIDLAGTWRLRLDPTDAGIGEEWFRQTLQDPIQLPGALTTQGYGEEPGTQTRWTGSVNDPSWTQDAEYAPIDNQVRSRFPSGYNPIVRIKVLRGTSAKLNFRPRGLADASPLCWNVRIGKRVSGGMNSRLVLTKACRPLTNMTCLRQHRRELIGSPCASTIE